MYNYKDFRQWATTDEGAQFRLIHMRDRAGDLFRRAGCATVERLVGGGDAWENLALVDRLAELRSFYIIENPYGPSTNNICFPIGDWWRR